MGVCYVVMVLFDFIFYRLVSVVSYVYTGVHVCFVDGDMYLGNFPSIEM